MAPHSSMLVPVAVFALSTMVERLTSAQPWVLGVKGGGSFCDANTSKGLLCFGGGRGVPLGDCGICEMMKNLTFSQLNHPLQNLRKHAKDAKIAPNRIAVGSDSHEA